jgi:hypothetical protein
MKKLEDDDSIYATFRAAYDVLTGLKTSVHPSVVSLCVPIGTFMNAAANNSNNAAGGGGGNIINNAGGGNSSSHAAGGNNSNNAAGNSHGNNTSHGNNSASGSVTEVDIYSGDSLRKTFAECLIKACHLVIGTENKKSVKAFREIYKRLAFGLPLHF